MHQHSRRCSKQYSGSSLVILAARSCIISTTSRGNDREACAELAWVGWLGYSACPFGIWKQHFEECKCPGRLERIGQLSVDAFIAVKMHKGVEGQIFARRCR